ncbi:protein of unknown function [Hyphomicrobium sp. MC1]|nr:protein of unknown function [Hyphomicrobium sp. MC1]
MFVFERYLEVVTREPSHSQGDPQKLTGIAVLGDPFYIVRWVTIPAFGRAVNQPLDLFKTQKQGVRKCRYTRHMKVLKQATNVLFPDALRPSASPSQLPGDLVKIWEPVTGLQAAGDVARTGRVAGTSGSRKSGIIRNSALVLPALAAKTQGFLAQVRMGNS